MELLLNKRLLLTTFFNLLIFYVCFSYVDALDLSMGRAFDDQMHFHYPAIQHFINGGEVADYSAAVTPGFHLLMATIANLVGLDIYALQLVNSLITALLILWISIDLFRRFENVLLSIVLVNIFTISVYVFPSGYWLLPDNLALLLAYAVLKISLRLEKKHTNDILILFLLSLLLSALVFTRQNYIWLASAPFFIALRLFYEKNTYRGSLVLLSIVPSICVLCYFVIVWKGLVPPSFQGIHQRISGSAIAFFLTVVGCYSIFFLPLLTNRSQLRGFVLSKRTLLISVFISLFIASLFPTTYSFEQGRYSGLWNIANLLPSYFERSVFVTLGAAFGGIAIVFWSSILPKSRWLVLGGSLWCFVLSLVFNAFVFERYISGILYLYFFIILIESNPSMVKPSKLAIFSLMMFLGINALLLIRSFSVATLLS